MIAAQRSDSQSSALTRSAILAPYMQPDIDWICLQIQMARHNFLTNLGKETQIGHWLLNLHVILIESGFSQ